MGQSQVNNCETLTDYSWGYFAVNLYVSFMDLATDCSKANSQDFLENPSNYQAR